MTGYLNTLVEVFTCLIWLV